MLTIVTGNIGKYEQISQILQGVIPTKQQAVELEEIQTNNLHEISAHKARKAFAVVQGSVLVDDSGIVFDAYAGFPGALTKYLYAGVGLEGIQKLFHKVENRKAQFVCVLSYMDKTIADPMQFTGTVDGELTFDRIGKEHENPQLPYDLIFKVQDTDEPVFYHMNVWKGKQSHRYKAGIKLREWLIERGYII